MFQNRRNFRSIRFDISHILLGWHRPNGPANGSHLKTPTSQYYTLKKTRRPWNWLSTLWPEVLFGDGRGQTRATLRDGGFGRWSFCKAWHDIWLEVSPSWVRWYAKYCKQFYVVLETFFFLNHSTGWTIFFFCRVMPYFWGAHRSIKFKRHLSQTLLAGNMFAAARGKNLFGQLAYGHLQRCRCFRCLWSGRRPWAFSCAYWVSAKREEKKISGHS